MATTDTSSPEPGEYELKVDAQVERFVETKQKLTYFLITASAAVTAFVVKFVVDHLTRDGEITASSLELALVVSSSIAGVVTSGLSLLNLREEHRSYARHLKYRYQKKNWDMLSENEQQAWDRITTGARRFLNGALMCLFFQIALAAAFFVVVFW